MDLGKISVVAVTAAHMVAAVTRAGRIHPGLLLDHNAEPHLLQHQHLLQLPLPHRHLQGSVAVSVPPMDMAKISAVVVIVALTVVAVTRVGRIHRGPLLDPSVTWSQQCSVAMSAKLMAMAMISVAVDTADLMVDAGSLAEKMQQRTLLDHSVAEALKSSSFEAIRSTFSLSP